MSYPAGNYMFKFNNTNAGTRCEICSKLTIKTFTYSKLTVETLKQGVKYVQS